MTETDIHPASAQHTPHVPTPAFLLGGVVYMRDPWTPHLHTLEQLLELIESLTTDRPQHLVVDCKMDCMARQVPWSQRELLTAVQQPGLAALTITGAQLQIGIEGFDEQGRHPSVLYFVLNPDADTCEARAARITQLWSLCAENLPVLHGGIDTYTDFERAASDLSMVATDLHKVSAEQAVRWRFDAANRARLWDRARRFFMMTFLGPELVGQADLQQAQQLPLRSVEDHSGSLLLVADVQAADLTDPSWRAGHREVFEWLWPRTLQTPVDRPRFDA